MECIRYSSRLKLTESIRNATLFGFAQPYSRSSWSFTWSKAYSKFIQIFYLFDPHSKHSRIYTVTTSGLPSVE